ncbi:MAG: L-histidine N(alpha)-methyltransferase [Acidobacteria bacterium]|nr:L-histidine N(alpha)-methyltransferase [Acidobacteriota bacterium]
MSRPRTMAVPPAETTAQFAADVRYYLSLVPRQLPSKYFYDPLGSALFDAITHLPWYTLKRAETRLLDVYAHGIFEAANPTTLVELGPGSGEKLLTLITAGGHARTPLDVRLVDISRAALVRATATLHARSAARVTTYEETYDAGLERLVREERGAGRTLVMFLGSNIGNFDPPGVDAFLRTVRAALGQSGTLLLGTDLVKPEPDLLRAYDDPLGVTAAFNKNLLVRINRELDGDFDVAACAHRAIWNAEAARIEMHLVSRTSQQVGIRGAGFVLQLEAGESIWTESSYKYQPADVQAVLAGAGFRVRAQWIDERDLFALTLAEADGSR